jgi:hypothetical protein
MEERAVESRMALQMPHLFLKPSELGARMRLQVGFTLATIFLALFTAALWKERSQKERLR